MLVATRLPFSKTERLELEDEIRYPASEEEFFDLLENTDYRVEYHAGEIICSMAYASDNHETITLNLGAYLKFLLAKKGFRGYGSSRPVYVPNLPGEQSYYNPDVFFIRKPQRLVRLRGEMTATANPAIICEVLSKTTFDFDQGEKYENYKSIESLEQVLFVDSRRVRAILCERNRRTGQWLKTTYRNMDDRIPILGYPALRMEDIYEDCILEG